MSTTDYNLLIETPENLALEMDIAGFGGRCIAAIFDYLILVLSSVIVALALVALVGFRSQYSLLAIGLFVQVTFFTLYFLIFELAWNGQTPGKRYLGMRVIQANGLPVSTSALFIRNLVRLFDFMPILYAVGLITMFATKRTQRLGDLAADTIVIYENPELTLRNLRVDYTINQMWVTYKEDVPSILDISNLTQDDRQLVVSYLQRRFDIAGRDRLATSIARHLGTKSELPDHIVHSFWHTGTAERFLEFVARAFDIQETESLADRSPNAQR